MSSDRSDVFLARMFAQLHLLWQFFTNLFNIIKIYNINKYLYFPSGFIKRFSSEAEKYHKKLNHIGKQLLDNVYDESCLLRILDKLKQIWKYQCKMKRTSWQYLSGLVHSGFIFGS